MNVVQLSRGVIGSLSLSLPFLRGGRVLYQNGRCLSSFSANPLSQKIAASPFSVSSSSLSPSSLSFLGREKKIEKYIQRRHISWDSFSPPPVEEEPEEKKKPKFAQVNMNEEIKATSVNLLDPAGLKLGVFSIESAMSLAEEQGCDLIEVNAKANPPYCKLKKKPTPSEINQAKRKEKKGGMKKKMKEIRMKHKIEENDVLIKIQKISRLLASKYRVKVSVLFHPRRDFDEEIGFELLRFVEDSVGSDGVLDSSLGYMNVESVYVYMILSPSRELLKGSPSRVVENEDNEESDWSDDDEEDEE